MKNITSTFIGFLILLMLFIGDYFASKYISSIPYIKPHSIGLIMFELPFVLFLCIFSIFMLGAICWTIGDTIIEMIKTKK